MKKIVVVGGLPNPIGGVTTFISRLIRAEKAVGVLFDLYPSVHKELPREYLGNYIYSNFRMLTLFRLFLFMAKHQDINVHFNFSTPRSLILLKWLPKRKSNWALTLHHGNLGAVQPWMSSVLNNKVDVVLPLNMVQERWYSSLKAKGIVFSSSYLPAGEPKPNRILQDELAKYRGQYDRILICSGYPTKIYNHELAFELMSHRPRDLLICCLYGPGDMRDKLKRMADGKNIVIKDSLTEDQFNYLLKESDLYLRLNSEDSFGIAVADAVNYGVRVVATDVCARYPGAVTIDIKADIAELNDVVQRTLDGVVAETSDVELPRFEYGRVFK